MCTLPCAFEPSDQLMMTTSWKLSKRIRPEKEAFEKRSIQICQADHNEGSVCFLLLFMCMQCWIRTNIHRWRMVKPSASPGFPPQNAKIDSIALLAFLDIKNYWWVLKKRKALKRPYQIYPAFTCAYCRLKGRNNFFCCLQYIQLDIWFDS